MNKQGANAPMSRRQFLTCFAAMSAAAAGFSGMAGCALDPVTGKKQLMMVSQQKEIEIDRQQSPFQFSSDYGITQDQNINAYVSDVGDRLLPFVHRPGMPYSFQCVNATYINAYAFPGGTIAVTRGILLKLDNEAQLAALLGHELGHVNARHAAEQMSKGQLSSLLVRGLSIAAAARGAGLGDLTQQIGMLGQGLLLSRYSRDNEREADALGNRYMVESGYASRGFVGLMEMLDSLNKKKPGSAQVLFSTHPMSDERLNSAVQREKGIYQHSKAYPLNRERYMDNISFLRGKKQGIELLQKGETYLAKKEYDRAEQVFKRSLKTLKHDYTAHVLMSRCLMIRGKALEAASHSDTATRLYPEEAQGYYLSGMAYSKLKKYTKAFQRFDKCDALLPGNPQLIFYKGYCLDKNGSSQSAANHYATYLKLINYQPNDYSRYAYNRLKQWGYAK